MHLVVYLPVPRGSGAEASSGRSSSSKRTGANAIRHSIPLGCPEATIRSVTQCKAGRRSRPLVAILIALLVVMFCMVCVCVDHGVMALLCRTTESRAFFLLSFPQGHMDLFECQGGRPPIRVADVSPSSSLGVGWV